MLPSKSAVAQQQDEQVCRLPEGTDSDLAARRAGLVFSSDCLPGIRRVRDARGFKYRSDLGEPLPLDEIARVELLRIPPAWTDVWICSDPRGHLQATGRDARGRKQYRYHERWRATRDETKYERLAEFGDALSRIRRRVDADLRHPTLSRERVLALAVAVLDEALVRVGNEQYARENESFGLTTLRDEHAQIGTTTVRLRFRGKAGKELSVGIDNPRIARAMRRMRDLPGQELFQYVDDRGEQRIVESGDVNDYLQEVSGVRISSKDFRTWGGSLAAAIILQAASGKPSEKVVVTAVKEAAGLLGNTPAVCRKAYIHPGLIDLYLAGGFCAAWQEARRIEPRRPYLRNEERIFLGVLKQIAGA